MKKLLICSIIRNQEQNILVWEKQLNHLQYLVGSEYECHLSVFENDSTDNTKGLLDGCKFPHFVSKEIRTKTLGTRQFGSIWSEERLRGLAYYRNQCLEAVDLAQFDKIAYIEPDVIYNPDWCQELILARHPAQARIEPDIYSGWSLRSEDNPKESMYLYDTTACRPYSDSLVWDFDKENDFFRKNLIKTSLSHIDTNVLFQIWSTFSCFCVYNAEPFKKGLRWNFINKRLDVGQGKMGDGWLDADTTVICEDFRALGYNNVYFNKNCIIRHN